MRPGRCKPLTDLSPLSRSGPLAEAAEPLSTEDLALVEQARAALLRHYRPFWHTLAAAIRGTDGRVWTGLHLGATVGRLSICAEAVALGRAVLEGDGGVETVVAVRHPKPEEACQDLEVVPPCGACREMFFDFSPDARIILPGPGKVLLKVPLRALLPNPYRR